ncbi:MAG TPA: hypothetical protein VGH38_19520 [Bryobacteraceae bacterium]
MAEGEQFVFNGACSISLTALLAISAAGQTNPGPTVAGCVQKNGEVYVLTDEKSHDKVQLRGTNLPTGRHVEVAGTTAENISPAAGTTQVIDVSSIKRTAGSCQNAGTGEHGSRLRGSTVASIAVIGGVAVFAIIKTASRLGEASGGK